MDSNIFWVVFNVIGFVLVILQIVFLANANSKFGRFLGINLSVYFMWLGLIFFQSPSEDLGILRTIGEAANNFIGLVFCYGGLLLLSIILLIIGAVIKIKNKITTNIKTVGESFVISLAAILLTIFVATLVAQLF